jgi:hypothetical protein
LDTIGGRSVRNPLSSAYPVLPAVILPALQDLTVVCRHGDCTKGPFDEDLPHGVGRMFYHKDRVAVSTGESSRGVEEGVDFQFARGKPAPAWGSDSESEL